MNREEVREGSGWSSRVDVVDEMAVFLAVPQEEAQIGFLDPVLLALWFVGIKTPLDSLSRPDSAVSLHLLWLNLMSVSVPAWDPLVCHLCARPPLCCGILPPASSGLGQVTWDAEPALSWTSAWDYLCQLSKDAAATMFLWFSEHFQGLLGPTSWRTFLILRVSTF